MLTANFLIAFREGLEAALIVSILVAYLKKAGREDLLPKMWVGVVIAAAIPMALGAYMTWGPYSLTFRAQEILGGTLSLVAAGLVTWMILWMADNSAQLKGEIEGSVGKALLGGKKYAVVWIAATAVAREGVETAVFVWAAVNSAASTSVAEPAWAVGAGLVAASALGYAIYKGAVRINLAKFFTVTGYFLILVAAGIVSYGIGDLQEASVLPGWGINLYSLNHLVDAHNPLYVLAAALFNFNAEPTHLQALAWVSYVVIVIPIFYRKSAIKIPKNSEIPHV